MKPQPTPEDMILWVKKQLETGDASWEMAREIVEYFRNKIRDCKDCGVDTKAIGEYPYMLRPEPWAQAHGDLYFGDASDTWPNGALTSNLERPDGILCISCLEKRLGCYVDANDFRYIPAHDEHERISPRLSSRLGFELCDWGARPNPQELPDTR